ncbi:MAG TPA: phosphate ABC transporter substrate-binding protein PstS [Tepidisphaeraceae bacterium]|nr:phosphate ABC transporter substrate-binding protein PstS [Tepidisphaeraceae bacterium]
MIEFFRRLAAGLVALTMTCGLAVADVNIQGGGSTFANPIQQAWIKAYSAQHPDVRIAYAAKGSGFGIASIIDKTIDFAGSDAPMNADELAKAKASGGDVVEIPICAGAVVASYNLPGFNGDLKLTGDVLANIYLGKVTQWNDPSIAAANPGATLPNLAITPVHRSDGSGTTFVFTNYLCTQSSDFESQLGAGKNVKWPGGQGAEGNQGVTQVVQSTPGAIGYIELAYAADNHIAFALMQNDDGKFIKATPDAVTAAGQAALQEMTDPNDLTVPLWDQDGDTVYPIAAYTYVIIYKDLGYLKDQAKAQALLDYLYWSTSSDQASELVGAQTYSPLSAGVKVKVESLLDTLTFNGQPIHPSH